MATRLMATRSVKSVGILYSVGRMNTASSTNKEKPNYGVDAPGVIRNLLVCGVGLILLGTFLPWITIGPVRIFLRPSALSTGVYCLLSGILMIAYVKIGKFRHRDRMLAMVKWRGNEQVLDVGTGRGLLMIGAAKKLSTGRSVGIDIWSHTDLSSNSMQGTRHNAELEGVLDRIDVRDGDATKMDFPDGSFDVVLSNLCIHNIPSREGRDQACREIVRVLKLGGRAIISDFRKTAQYAEAFRAAGASVKRSGMYWLDTFPPLRIVEVEKQ
jgi:arsenite methyltransferase